MSFGAPLWLLLIPLALVAAAIVARVRRRARASLRPFAAQVEASRSRPALEPAESWMTLLGCALLSIALAQPRLRASDADRDEERWGPPPCIFVLDGSRSMLAEDVAPNRFRAASARLLALARAEPGRRFGLVLFAGDAREVAPPTSDLDALAALLGEIDPRRSADPGSSAGRGLELALARLAPEARGEIVLLSDGEWDDRLEPGAADPTELVARARAIGLQVDAECFGAAAPTPIIFRDDQGGVVEAEPATFTTASPARVAELAERAGTRDRRPDADAAATAAAGESRSAHRFRAWALAGLALLAAAHWFAGRDE